MYDNRTMKAGIFKTSNLGVHKPLKNMEPIQRFEPKNISSSNRTTFITVQQVSSEPFPGATGLD
ncbi:hypothetical protein PABG_11721 [Paracoccidioides brasiliensis Pb03]|nr:hypothetical protein PABG_11721 [Paracoccidioides brasiliensis Pb03]